jgi:PAS domain S-box-containing protein
MGPVVRLESRNAKEHIRKLLAWLGGTEHQLSLAIDAAELGICHWVPSTGQMYWSERCCELLDVPAGMAPSLELFFERVHPEDRDFVNRSITEAVTSGQPLSMEFRALLRDGRIRLLNSRSGMTGVGPAGEPPRMSGVIQDVTELRAAADALLKQRQLEQQIRLWSGAFEHSAAAMALVDAAGCRFRAINPAYCRLSGYAPEELIGQPAPMVYAADQVPILLAAAQQADQNGRSQTDIIRLHKDGTPFPVTLDMVSVKDSQGNVLYRVVTTTDKREQARIQATLRHHEAIHYADQRFKLLAQSAPIGIVLADPDGAITYANPAWLATTAISLGQALSMDWFDLVHPDDRDRVVAAWQRTREGAVFDLEFRYRRPSGEARWVQAHASELTDADGQSLGFVRTSLDITDRLLERAASDRFHSQVRVLAQRLQDMRDVERSEIAGELQDAVHKGLVGLKDEAYQLAERAAAGSEEAQMSARMVCIAQETLEGLRRVLFDLNPPGIAEIGFAAALQRFADEQAAHSGCRITLELPSGEPALHQQTLEIVYAVAREGIGNAIVHGKATSIDLALEVVGGTAKLRVSDNGLGIGDKDRTKPGAIGLLAASERLAHIGGTLRVMGIQGRGTMLEASVPVRKAAPRYPARG